MIFLDTHIVIWLYQKEPDLLTGIEKNAIENNDLFISPIVLLEIEYLFEIGKIKKNANKITGFLANRIGMEIEKSDFSKIIEISLKEKWTRDPFDRIIVSHARYKEAYLLTRDEKIRENYSKVIK